MAYEQTKNYEEQGGARTVIGGELDIVAGGTLKIAGTAITQTAAQLNALPVVAQAAEADLAGGADLPTTVTKINAILAKLRLANIIGV
jgi:hypothetical protein